MTPNNASAIQILSYSVETIHLTQTAASVSCEGKNIPCQRWIVTQGVTYTTHVAEDGAGEENAHAHDICGG